MNATTLQRPVLVLNKSWVPCNVASVKRAMKLLFKGAARVVDITDYQMYDWQDWSRLRRNDSLLGFQLPEVVVLTAYNKVPSKSVTFSRRNLFRRDKYQCQFCGKNPKADELTVDHVKPRSQQGVSSWTNCVLACLQCNKRKADRTPEQAGMKLRKVPVQPAWKPIYANSSIRLDSWEKFMGSVYWNAELQR